ncbi:MAG TPA: hypothetical protein VGS10_13005, partial [Terracidiphilus sp.]|nr:hypothetical protein [Terracidiphilus sp.]
MPSLLGLKCGLFGFSFEGAGWETGFVSDCDLSALRRSGFDMLLPCVHEFTRELVKLFDFPGGFAGRFDLV